MVDPIPFAGGTLDRVENERRDPAWLAKQLESEASRFLPVWRGRILAKTGDGAGLAWARGMVREEMDPDVGGVLLGVQDGVAHFAVDVSDHEAPLEVLGVEGAADFADLRALATVLPAAEAAVAGHARARVDWHARHGFCSACGGKTVSRAGGVHRGCIECGAEHFPRTDPVAIAVVGHGEHCLLGRQRGWPARMFSALAGFVETGETIEEAVRREVREEAGVAIGAVRYVASQPWPFPSSLMIACIAEAESEALRVDHVELEDARWFERATIASALAGEIPDELVVPPPLAIAHHLMKEWLGAGG